MSSIKSNYNLSNLDSLPEMTRFLQQFTQDVIDTINGNLEFNKNIRSVTLTASFTKADTELLIAHNLGRTPTGYLIYGLSVATTVYTGASTWTASNIFLKASVVATVKLIIF